MLIPAGKEGEGPGSEGTHIEDSLAARYRLAVAGLTSPEYQRRKEIRTRIQRQGYTETLYELQRDDPFSALLAATRMLLRLEFAIPRYPLTVTVPIQQPPSRDSGFLRLTIIPSPPMVIRLHEDRTLPKDPWAPR